MSKRLLAVAGSGALLAGCSPQGELGSAELDEAGGGGDVVATSTAPVGEQDSYTVALELPGDATEGSVLSTAPAQSGTAAVTVEVVSLDGGQVVVSTGRDDALVLDFPAYAESEDAPPRAIVRVTPRSKGVDPLAPGDADFSFGAEFRIDTESKGTEVDNGDNLIQRGLASDPSQYKFEVDGDRPACRVRGSAGDVQVRLDREVLPGSWYAARCSRIGDSVELSVTEYGRDGRTNEFSATERGPTGILEWPKSQTPISIGGKLAANGEVIRSATDQFNGLVSNPFLVIQD